MKISDYAHYNVLLSLLLKWSLWLCSLLCFTFTTIKIKYLTMFTTPFYFIDYIHYAVLLSLLLKWNLLLCSLQCFSSLTTLTALFSFTMLTPLLFFTDYTHYAALLHNHKMKYLTMLTKLFFFTGYTHFAVLLHYYQMEISDYTHLNILLSLLLKWNLRLFLLRCFTFSTIKMKYLTTLTTLFFFTDFTHYPVLLHYY